MTIDRRLLAGSLGFALLLAACGGGASATKAPESAAPATQAAQPSAAAPSEATESAEPTEEATEQATDNGGTLPGGALTGLAGTLPEEANGIKFQRAGYDGDQLGVFGAAAGINSEELDPILKANGKTITDVNFAISTPADSNSGSTAMIYAIQIEGVSADKFAGGMNMDLATMPKANIAGKDVYGQGSGGFSVYVYLKNDVMYVLLFTDEATTKAIMEKLP